MEEVWLMTWWHLSLHNRSHHFEVWSDGMFAVLGGLNYQLRHFGSYFIPSFAGASILMPRVSWDLSSLTLSSAGVAMSIITSRAPKASHLFSKSIADPNTYVGKCHGLLHRLHQLEHGQSFTWTGALNQLPPLRMMIQCESIDWWKRQSSGKAAPDSAYDVTRWIACNMSHSRTMAVDMQF